MEYTLEEMTHAEYLDLRNNQKQFVNYITNKSGKLLMMLYEHMLQDKYIYRHNWKPNMLIAWDNRTVMHQAEGGYDGYERLLHRITIAGEHPRK